MKLRIPVLVTLTLFTTQCRKEAKSVIESPVVMMSTPSEVGGFSTNSLHQHIGELVTVHGQFSVAPFIRNGDSTIYLKPGGSYAWGKEYDRMEGQQVTATGVLQFRHFEPSPGQHPPDYYYFQAETTTLKLLK